MSVRLEDWFMGWATNDPFIPPELRGKSLCGRVYGHEEFEDGTNVAIVIASLAKSEGRTVSTADGQTLELGKPEPGYLEWLKSAGIPYDEKNPIKLVEEYQYPDRSGVRPPNGGRASS